MDNGRLRTADGPLCLLLEGRSAVRQVAVRAWSDWLWLGESRVRRDEDYHERWRGLAPYAEAHKEWNLEPCRVIGVSNARVGWMYARHGKWEGLEHSLCRCGASTPDRAHWAWECTFTGGAQTAARVPAHQGERRLCVPLVDRPARGWEERSWGVIGGLRTAVVSEVWRVGRAVIATDGGAQGKIFRERVAAYGVAVGMRTWNGRVGGIDQSAYMAELWALYKVLKSIEGLGGEIWIIIDNYAVMDEADRRRRGFKKLSGCCPGLWFKVQQLIDKTLGLRFGWVPSHGKKMESWKPPDGHCADEWRRLNDAADLAVGVTRDQRWIEEAAMRDSWNNARLRARAALGRLWKGAEAFRADYPEDDDNLGGGKKGGGKGRGKTRKGAQEGKGSGGDGGGGGGNGDDGADETDHRAWTISDGASGSGG